MTSLLNFQTILHDRTPYLFIDPAYEDATQVFGGRALTVTGMGKYIENVSSRSFSLCVAFSHSRFFGGYGSISILVSIH
jgi:hypothetical protein